MEKSRQKTLPIIYYKVNTDFVHYSNYTLNSSPIKALHYHDKVELGICLSGKGVTRINQEVFEFGEGDVQVIPSGVAHLSTSQEGSISNWVWITFSPLEVFKKAGIVHPENALNITDSTNIICGVFNKDKYPSITKTINYLVDCVKQYKNNYQDKNNYQAVAFALGSFLIESSRIAKDNPSQENKPFIASTEVISLMDYISDNLDDNLALSEKSLAKKMGISIASLNRKFIAQTGYPPKTFVIRCRMSTAEWLLVRSDHSITEISLRVGYSDTSGFNRIFKRFFSLSPYQYRKKFKK